MREALEIPLQYRHKAVFFVFFLFFQLYLIGWHFRFEVVNTNTVKSTAYFNRHYKHKVLLIPFLFLRRLSSTLKKKKRSEDFSLVLTLTRCSVSRSLFSFSSHGNMSYFSFAIKFFRLVRRM